MIRALLLDAGGTLLSPAEPVAVTYARAAQLWGLSATAEEIGPRFRSVFRDLDEQQIGDGRLYWRRVVRGALGPDAEALHADAFEALFEALYARYLLPDAWTLAPSARETLPALREAGLSVAVVSNWDARLRPLLQSMGLSPWLDAVVLSGELGLEKPDPALLLVACARLGVPPGEALHVGDSARKDVAAAQAAGCRALHWGVDLQDFAALPGWLSRLG